MSDAREANESDAHVGREVRRRRLEINMSQERLAEILGVTFQQVQQYEKGVNRIAASRLWDIAKALEHPVAKFFPNRLPSQKPLEEFAVEWRIDVRATDPRDAAAEAAIIHREGRANIYHVATPDGFVEIDLDSEEQ